MELPSSLYTFRRCPTEKLTKAFSLNPARVKHRTIGPIGWAQSGQLNQFWRPFGLSETVGDFLARPFARQDTHTHIYIHSFVRMAKHDREQRCSRTSVYVYMRNYVNQLKSPRYLLICRVNSALVCDTSHSSQKIALTKIAVKGHAIIRYVYVCFEIQLIYILSILDVCRYQIVYVCIFSTE